MAGGTNAHTHSTLHTHPPVMFISCSSCCRALFSACSAAISPRRRCACSFFLQGGRGGGAGDGSG